MEYRTWQGRSSREPSAQSQNLLGNEGIWGHSKPRQGGFAPWTPKPCHLSCFCTRDRQLRRERQERGWTQQRVADEIQARFPDAAVTGGYVTRWENGKRKPRPYYQEKLCIIYGKSAS
ncbi:MAG: helix-turn-helix transcriptional regulator [Chloroflexi bacterium]|nr:MAG: helix-turn-helix transcriptional regulator [Chloroflexota bacterium]